MDPEKNQAPLPPTQAPPSSVPPQNNVPEQQPAQQPLAPSQPQIPTPSVLPEGNVEPLQEQSYNNVPNQPQTMPTQSTMPAQPTTPETDMIKMSAPKSQAKKIVIVIVILILFAAAAAAVYFIFFNGGRSVTQTANESSSSVQATEMATLSDVSLTLDTVPTGYTEQAVSDASNYKYYVSDDGLCEFAFGTLTSENLPGKDLDAIVTPQITTLKENGATVNGPNAGTPLVLKSTTDSNVKYSMPTLNYVVSKGTVNLISHYSAVVLKNDSRAVVSRSCGNKNGAADESRLQALDDVAQTILVTAK